MLPSFFPICSLTKFDPTLKVLLSYRQKDLHSLLNGMAISDDDLDGLVNVFFREENSSAFPDTASESDQREFNMEELDWVLQQSQLRSVVIRVYSSFAGTVCNVIVESSKDKDMYSELNKLLWQSYKDITNCLQWKKSESNGCFLLHFAYTRAETCNASCLISTLFRKMLWLQLAALNLSAPYPALVFYSTSWTGKG